MELLSTIDPAHWSLLTEVAKAELTQQLIVYGVMWSIIKKSVAGHFEKIEVSLDRIATGLEDHSKRIEKIEDSLNELIKK